MATTLVTGGSGFIGQAVTEALLQNGEQVRMLDLREPPAALAGRLEFRQGSILDQAMLRDAMRGCQRVFHLAAIPELWLADKRGFEQVNTVGTEKVLDAAARAGVRRLVYTSTESIVVGTRRRSGNADENTAVTLKDMPGPYCRSKFLAEAAARRAAQQGLPVVIVNPTLPIGAGDLRLTPPSRMLLGYLNGEYSAYLDSAFNLVHVRDVAQGHLLAADKGRVGERYMLAGENLRLSELLAILQQLTGLPMPRRRVPWLVALGFAAVSEFIADHITHQPPMAPITGVRLARRPMFFDNRKAREELGLELTPAAVALGDAIADFRARGLITRSA